jgi:uncharacterized repeat protein (TIGR03837 family)
MSVDILALRPRWEIFCQVVDNFGDIGVCWRLARELARREGTPARLWVDDWTAFARLCPQAGALPGGGFIDGVEVRPWTQPFASVIPGEVVIEAFACTLPPTHLDAMAEQIPRPLWINLEYLSAEDWVAGCHGLASPHPQRALLKHFFFPGFDETTGGLLREADVLARRELFCADADGRRRWLAARGIGEQPAHTLYVSLFSYEQPGLASLLQAWANGPRPVMLLVPEGRVLGDVAGALGRDALAAGDLLEHDRLSVCVLPFSEQDAYDTLLWLCDLNFVRGEDSFVRAQWAARPFVWHIYPQADQAHRAKLDAFLARYTVGLSGPAASALADMWRAWNGFEDEQEAGQMHDYDAVARAWPAFADALPELQAHAHTWCSTLAATPDLASRLTKFCSHILSAPG